VRSEDQTGRRKKEADTILPRIARAVSRSHLQAEIHHRPTSPSPLSTWPIHWQMMLAILFICM
jgi:hypothetical protein